MTSTPNKRAPAAAVNANVQSPGKGDAPRFLSLLQEMQNRDVDGGRPGVDARLTPSGKGKERAVEEDARRATENDDDDAAAREEKRADTSGRGS